mmetsp:Transcript_15367/g.36367  ORF Transcript_15367/g.36367 Transcript_15367/m.36367 type:complete len:139 (-) Transcript_15367:198-614(-)
MQSKAGMIAALSLVAIALQGCSDDSTSDVSTETTATTTAAVTTTAAATTTEDMCSNMTCGAEGLNNCSTAFMAAQTTNGTDMCMVMTDYFGCLATGCCCMDNFTMNDTMMSVKMMIDGMLQEPNATTMCPNVTNPCMM